MELVFWPAPVRLHPFEAHVRAAAAGGFDSLAIAPTTFLEARSRGLTATTMRSIAEDAGVPLRHLDTIATWAPIQLGTYEFDRELNDRCRVSVETGLEICEQLELRQILATSAYQRDAVPLSQLVDGMGEFCRKAEARDIWIDLEPMPFFGCHDVASAWSIIENTGQQNIGILMDTWHFFKANQTLEVLAGIPDRCFRTMQINDAPRAQITDSLIEDTIKHRRWPGRGELPVTDFIRAVADRKHLRATGQEVFSLEADALSPEEAGRIAGETTREALRAAGVATRPVTPRS